MKIVINDKRVKNEVKVIFSQDVDSTCLITGGKDDVLMIKTTKVEQMNRRKWALLIREVVREVKKHKIENIRIVWGEITAYDNLGENLGEVFARNAFIANYEFRKYKKKPKEGWKDIKKIIIDAKEKDRVELKKSIKKGSVVAKYINISRDLANTPGNDMTPKILASETKKIMKNLTNVSVNILGEKQINAKKMGGVIAVGKGSSNESQFIIVTYNGAKDKSEKPIVLVGKGVTFDTGGIDTKPYPHALDMMMDMSGGASVIATIGALAELKVKKNIVALVPAVENMPDGGSFRPGDVIKMMNGTTVEIGHTDAEGRLILADALTYAKTFKPQKVIDVATLTGASMMALGERAMAVFTRNDEFAKEIIKSSEESGDFAWRLPLWEEYEEEVKGKIAEISNIGRTNYGGAITAATFLHYFAKDFKEWVHLDIAPTMTSIEGDFLTKGAKGPGVALLINLLDD